MQTSYRFGKFEVQVSQRALLVDGVPAALGGRAFDMLVVLVQRAGQVVGKDQLLDAVWGRVVVEEGNLHVQMSALRKLLGAETIATIPGRGYRFTPMLDAPAIGAAAAAAPALMPPRRGVPERLPALFGRERDLAALDGLMAAHRLVSILGPGGIGKTRLALAALWSQRERHADGVAVVELAALADAAMLPGAIAAALQLPLSGTQDSLAAIAAAVRPLKVLILLDNAEHLVEAVAALAQRLLQGDAAVRLLVTSQIPLKLDEEQAYRLSGLEVPAAGLTAEEALRCGAVALFAERAQAADRHFQVDDANVVKVVEICRRLDGIALAIELAAARCPLLGLQMLSQHLDERLRMLRSASRTAPTRQQTLLAAMDWSHALLSPAQQTAFRRLGVFAGGFTIALGRRLLAPPGADPLDDWDNVDLLADLVDHSLVAVHGGDVPRYRLLETGRAFALDKLTQAGEVAEMRQRHAGAMQQLFEQAFEDGWLMPEADFVAHYEPDLDNLRAALDWAVLHRPACAIALAGASARLWRGLSLHPEALRRCEAASGLIAEGTPPAHAARLWEAIAQLSGEISSAASRPAALRAAQGYQQLGDRRGHYVALAHVAFSYRSGTSEAQAAFTRMQQIEDPTWPPAVRLLGCKVQAGLASDAGLLDAARAANQTRLALATAAGSERDVHAALGNLADLALIAGDADAAVRLGTDLLARLGRRQLATRAIALGNLLLALLARSAPGARTHHGRNLLDPRARPVLTEFVEVARQLDHMYVMYAADAMALLAAQEARWPATARLLGYADAAHAADRQEREPNEARARATADGLLQGAASAVEINAWREQGSRLSPDAVCALAQEMPVRADAVRPRSSADPPA